jgi:hypothetical protein
VEPAAPPLGRLTPIIFFAVVAVLAVTLLIARWVVKSPEARAIGEVELLGGTYTRDEARNGAPVVAIDLQSTRIFDSGRRRNSRKTATDATLVLIARLHELQALSLVDTPVTDKGLYHLGGLHALETLDVRGTQVTVEGLNRLKVALPRLREIRGPERGTALFPVLPESRGADNR